MVIYLGQFAAFTKDIYGALAESSSLHILQDAYNRCQRIDIVIQVERKIENKNGI